MKSLVSALRLQLPFLVAGFLSFLFSVWLYFVADEKQAGIFVGLWVPSIHSLGALMLTGTRAGELVPVEVSHRDAGDRVTS